MASGSEKSAAKVAGILLAAGQSTRMGEKNKLLLPLGGRPLILHPLQAMQEAGLTPIVVVLGHERERIARILPGRVRVVENPRFVSGMASSIAAGIAALQATVRGAFLVFADMPLLTPHHFRQLLRRFASENRIVVPCVGKRRGHPVLFGRKYFPELANLTGDHGARGLLEKYAQCVVTVDVGDEAVFADIDDPETFEKLQKRWEK